MPQPLLATFHRQALIVHSDGRPVLHVAAGLKITEF